LQNARTKAEAEVSHKFQQQYGEYVALGNRIEANPVETVVQLLQGLSQHPEHGAAATTAIARILGSRRGQQSAPQDQAAQEPQADLQASDGTLVYSAERLAQWQQWNSQKLMAEVEQRLAPLQQREQQALAQERYQQRWQEAQANTSKILAPYQALPEFSENKPAIAAKAKSLMESGIKAEQAIGLAVAHVLREVVLPSRAAQSQQQLQATAVQKSLGSTSAPGASPSAPAGRPRSFEEGFRRAAI